MQLSNTCFLEAASEIEWSAACSSKPEEMKWFYFYRFPYPVFVSASLKYCNKGEYLCNIKDSQTAIFFFLLCQEAYNDSDSY